MKGEGAMSEDFTWQVAAATSRHTPNSLRVAIVLACAGVGIIVGCLYPLNLVMTAIDRASLPRVTAKGSMPSGEMLPKLARVEPHEPPETPHAASQMVLLNPGTADPEVAQEEPSSEKLPVAKPFAPRGQGQGATALRGDRPVWVVVRRRGPPYDTKILRGRIRNGQLFVNARGITLR
jgi:hypothetical protein